MKGQLNLEFMSAAFIYLSVLGAVILLGAGNLPEISERSNVQSLNLRAEQKTTELLTGQGSFDNGNNDGKEWEENIQHVEDLGFAEDFLILDRDKLEALETVGEDSFNYSQFRDIENPDQQYRFRFTWRPVIENFNSFEKCNPPGKIDEPGDCGDDQTTYYETAGNKVMYGQETLNGTTYYFLVTSHDGRYNTTYVTDTVVDGEREFSSNPCISDDGTGKPCGEGDRFSLEAAERDYRIEEIQDSEGSAVVLNQLLKEYGASLNTDSRTVKINRYASMENEPVKVEVWTW